MTALSIILAMLAVVILLGIVAAVVWLLRTLKWEVVDDDELQYRTARGRGSGWSWAKAWLKPGRPLLTYRRDRRGRFRRHRR